MEVSISREQKPPISKINYPHNWQHIPKAKTSRGGKHHFILINGKYKRRYILNAWTRDFDEHSCVKEMLMAVTRQMGPGKTIAANFNNQFSSKEIIC